MLDIRKPLGLLFIILGTVLFLYGAFLQKEVMFFTPHIKFPLKLNQPVGAFMFAFGLIMWQLSRYVSISRLEKGLRAREAELEGRASIEDEASAESVEPPSGGEPTSVGDEAASEGGVQAEATEQTEESKTQDDSAIEKSAGTDGEKTDSSETPPAVSDDETKSDKT